MTHDPTLYNDDLAPVPDSRRTWNHWHFAALWVGMAVCVTTYTLAGSLIQVGMTAGQAVFTIFLGNLVVLIPMILCAHAGTRYGIPFPVFARAAFGVRGANVPAVLRAIVACGWFGIQTWYGGEAIYQLVVALAPGFGGGVAIEGLGINGGELSCFLAFWLLNVWFVWHGTESIKWLETWSAPFLIVVGLGLLGWAWTRAGGFGPMLAAPENFPAGKSFATVFFPSLTAMVGYWATLSLNIPDFTRFAKDQRAQVLGQSLGLPLTMTLFAFIGISVTSASQVIFEGEPIWDPVLLIARIGNGPATVLAMFAIAIATLTTNIAANVVSPANDFSNLAPRRISYRMGGMITAVIGVVMMPWRILSSTQNYIFTWLIGYSALLGPIGGILIADYFILRRRHLEVDDLYRRGGAYEYRNGINRRALVAFAAGVLPCLPGFLAVSFPGTFQGVVPGFFTALYDYAWFAGFLIAGTLHVVLARAR